MYLSDPVQIQVGERASAITGTDNSLATHWQLTGTSVAPQWQVPLGASTQRQLTGTSVAPQWQVPLGASTQRQLTGTSVAPQWHLSGTSVASLWQVPQTCIDNVFF